MSFRWAEHVGELELWIESPDEPAVFVDALQALGELVGDVDAPGQRGPESLEVTAAGEDRAVLLAAWLEELCFLAETDGFAADTVDDLALEPGRVRARIRGRRASRPDLVKAVTYHRLSFAPSDGGWRAVVVLDV